MRVSSITKNAGKACNNRLYRHIRTFEKIIKNYFVIYIKILINEKETIRITRDSAWRYTDDNRFGYAYVWEQAKILKMISDKLREKDVPVPEVKLIGLW